MAVLEAEAHRAAATAQRAVAAMVDEALAATTPAAVDEYVTAVCTAAGDAHELSEAAIRSTRHRLASEQTVGMADFAAAVHAQRGAEHAVFLAAQVYFQAAAREPATLEEIRAHLGAARDAHRAAGVALDAATQAFLGWTA